MKEKLSDIISKLESSDFAEENYNIARSALVKIYKDVHDCTFEQAEKVVSEATYADQMQSFIETKPHYLIDIAKGLQLLIEGTEVTTQKSKLKLKKPDPRKVFVVHGRNSRLRDDFFNFLRAIKLEPIEWSEAVKLTGSGSPYIGEIIDGAFFISQAIVVLLTPDDEVKLKSEFITDDDPIFEKEMTGQARPNVLFEAGMAYGRNSHKTILVQVGSIKPFSDIGGRHVVRLDNSSIQRQEIADRLITAGCSVSLEGKDWHKIGNFQL